MTRIDPSPDFESRHLGPSSKSVEAMLQTLEYKSVEALVEDVVPESIYFSDALALPAALSEADFLERLRNTLSENQVQ